ncbi:MAG: antibiotic biosynthesis monooxygenase family protein [Syntrophaceae bacterium]
MKVTIQMKARPEKTQELDQTLRALLPAIRGERGCRSCRVYRDLEDAGTSFLEIDWDGPTNLQKFMQSPRGGALLGAIDLLSESPRVNLGGKEPWVGISSLKKLRAKEK